MGLTPQERGLIGAEERFKIEELDNISKKVKERLKELKLGFPYGAALDFSKTEAGQLERTIILPDRVIDGIKLYLDGFAIYEKDCPDYHHYSFDVFVKSATKSGKQYHVRIFEKWRVHYPERIFGLERMLCKCTCEDYSYGDTSRSGKYRFCKHIIVALCAIVFNPLKDVNKYLISRLPQHKKCFYKGKSDAVIELEVTEKMHHIATFLLSVIFFSSFSEFYELSGKLKEKTYAKCLSKWKDNPLLTQKKRLNIKAYTPSFELGALNKKTVMSIAYSILKASPKIAPPQFEERRKKVLEGILKECERHKKELESKKINLEGIPRKTCISGNQTLEGINLALIKNEVFSRMVFLKSLIKNTLEITDRLRNLNALEKELYNVSFSRYSKIVAAFEEDLENMAYEYDYLNTQIDKISESNPNIEIPKELWTRTLEQKIYLYKLLDFYFTLGLFFSRERTINLGKERLRKFINSIFKKTPQERVALLKELLKRLPIIAQ